METESRFLYGDGVETSSISTSTSDQKSQKSPVGSIHTLPWKLLEGHLLSFLSFRLTLHPPSPLLQQRPETEKPETEILTLLFSSAFLPRGAQKLRRQKLSPTPDAPTFPSRGQEARNRETDAKMARRHRRRVMIRPRRAGAPPDIGRHGEARARRSDADSELRCYDRALQGAGGGSAQHAPALGACAMPATCSRASTVSPRLRLRAKLAGLDAPLSDGRLVAERWSHGLAETCGFTMLMGSEAVGIFFARSHCGHSRARPICSSSGASRARLLRRLVLHADACSSWLITSVSRFLVSEPLSARHEGPGIGSVSGFSISGCPGESEGDKVIMSVYCCVVHECSQTGSAFGS